MKKDKGNDSVPIFVEVNGQKLVLGVLSPDNCTHIPFDLVFEKEFVLSHNWKNGSVYFCGYKSVPEEYPFSYFFVIFLDTYLLLLLPFCIEENFLL